MGPPLDPAAFGTQGILKHSDNRTIISLVLHVTLSQGFAFILNYSPGKQKWQTALPLLVPVRCLLSLIRSTERKAICYRGLWGIR